MRSANSASATGPLPSASGSVGGSTTTNCSHPKDTTGPAQRGGRTPMARSPIPIATDSFIVACSANSWSWMATCGCSSCQRWSGSISIESTSVGNVATSKTPTSNPAMLRAWRVSRSAAASAPRASPRRARPSGVGCTPRRSRSRRRLPKNSSRARNCWESAGCETPSRRAPAVTDPSSTTVTQARRCRRLTASSSGRSGIRVCLSFISGLCP